jgi:hypothetical protein
MEFRGATKVSLYNIDGLEGFWRRITAAEAKERPDAVRAKPGKCVWWFVPAEEEIVDLTLVDDDEEKPGQA